jgi:GNAT superfamily N-acetyltransferase
VTRVHELRFRAADRGDAEAVARLHADSWRRHYRGAYSDAFLDGEVLPDRVAVWTERLRNRDPRRLTLLAEADGLVGFANTVFEESRTWGALLDNLHVASGHKRRGIGSQLIELTAEALARRPHRTGLYLWVLEQNHDARAFYEALGARLEGREQVTPPGGVVGRLCGSPAKLRYVWADPSALRVTSVESP